MSPSRLLRLGALALVATAFTAFSCSDHPHDGDSTSTDPAKAVSTALEPLPEAPKIQVDRQKLPGSNGDLAVVAARPTDETRADVRPTLTFSKPVVSLEMLDTTKGPGEFVSMKPSVEGVWKWLGSASMEFVPTKPFPNGTHFDVTVKKGMVALDGAQMKEPYAYSFETPRPAVSSSKPDSKFSWASSKESLELCFNMPVKDLGKHVTLKTGGGRSIALSVGPQKVAEKEKPDPNCYSLNPGKLPLGTALTVTVDTGLTGDQGPLGMKEEWSSTFNTHPPMAILGLAPCHDVERCPYGPLLIKTTSRVDVSTLKERFSISPEVAIDWEGVASGLPYSWEEKGTPYVAIPGKFRPGTAYTIVVKKGLKDEEGDAADAFTGTVTTSDLEPTFSLGSRIALVESKDQGKLPVDTANIDSAQVSIWRMTPGELARYLGWQGKRESEPLPASEPHTFALDVKAPRNTPRKIPLDLRAELAEGTTGGLFLVQGEAPQACRNRNERCIDTVLAQVTDLAVHAKFSPKNSLLYVTRLSTGKPEGGVDVSLVDRTGTTVWTGRTDAHGLANAPGTEEFSHGKESREWGPPELLAVGSKDGDTGATLSSWDDGLSPYAFGMPGGWERSEPVALGEIFTERGVYRPGDEVMLKGIIRQRKLGVIGKLPKGTPIALELIDSRSRTIEKRDTTVGAFGSFDAKFIVPKDAPLGTFQLRAAAKERTWATTFRVEEYRAPQFKVDVAGPSDASKGDDLKVQATGRYLFGGAMGGADVQWAVLRETVGFQPPNNDTFSFGPETWLWNDDRPNETSESFASGQGKLDANGTLDIKVGRAETPADRTWQYSVEAEVTDVNRQRVANRTTITVHPSSIYVGMRTSLSGFAEVNKPVPVELIAVTPQGDRKAGIALSLEVSRRDWKSIRKKGAGGEWFTETEAVESKVSDCKETSSASTVTCAFTPKEAGLYLLKATGTDGQGRVHTSSIGVYVSGGGWVSWQRNDTDRIDLVADKQLYDVGDTAKILIKSPYPETEALVTIEREGILRTRTLHLKGSASTVDLPISEEMLPNVFVGVVLTRGRVSDKDGVETGDDPGRPATRFGYVQLKVEKKSKRLAVKLTPDTTEKRPRDTVTVAIDVANFKGKPQKSEVHVWAVDEAVLRLTAYTPPDLVTSVHVERSLSTRIAEPLIHLVHRALYGEKGSSQGGSGGGDLSGVDIRSQFKTTVLFQSVQTDASGHATVSFKLPDNLTTFRIMAIAASGDDLFGAATSAIQVAKPLLALPATPRFARVGDTFEAGVVVHAHNQKFPEVKVTAVVDGTFATLDGPATQTIALNDDKPQEVRFSYKGVKEGIASLKFAVVGGAESDGVEQKLPIQLPVSMEAVATYGDTTDKRVEGIVPPGGVRPGLGGLTITTASTALGNFDETMKYLIEYPYGCVEQLSSRLIPLVALRELHGLFKIPMDLSNPAHYAGWLDADSLKLAGAKDPDDLVKKTVEVIQSRQQEDGGFGYWANSTYPSPHGSAYAVLALARAKEVGYPVDATHLKKGQRFLSEQVAAGRCIRDWSGCQKPDDATRVFALYALARSRAPVASYYTELFNKRAKLPLFAQAMLADAIQIGGGDKAQAKKLMMELLNHAKESQSEIYLDEGEGHEYDYLWSSNTRTTAIALETLTDVQPDHPHVAKMAHWLTGKARLANGRYRNTQESAWSLMALTEVVRVKESQTPDFIAKAVLGDKELLAKPFKGRSMKVETSQIPIDQLTQLGAKTPLTFQVDGKGVLYYGALLRYAPKELPTKPLDQGIVVQRWFEPYEGGGQAKSFKAGDLVRVTVRIGTPMERHYVVLDVPLPAGLEPIDTSLASNSNLLLQKKGPPRSRSDSRDGDGDGDEDDSSGRSQNDWDDGWFYTPFNHVEIRDDRVVLFSDELQPGVYTKSFITRATSPGVFILKPAQAEEMYAPEVFGRSDGGKFAVTLPSPGKK